MFFFCHPPLMWYLFSTCLPLVPKTKLLVTQCGRAELVVLMDVRTEFVALVEEDIPQLVSHVVCSKSKNVTVEMWPKVLKRGRMKKKIIKNLSSQEKFMGYVNFFQRHQNPLIYRKSVFSIKNWKVRAQFRWKWASKYRKWAGWK